MRGQAAVARLGDLLERLGGREVDDVERHARHLGEADRAVRRLGFGARRPRERMPLRRRMALGERSPHEHIDDVAVLGVHADRPAVLPGLEEGAEDGAVVEHQDAAVRHEELERRHALLDEDVHLLLDGVGEVRDDHVEAVVDCGLAFRLFHPGVARLAQRLALVLDREVHDGRRAAVRGGDRAALEVVGRRRAAERHVEMRVRVDAARDHELARGVEDAGVESGRGAGGEDRGDRRALDEHVAPVVVDGGDDAPALDEKTAHNATSLS